jgi:peptidoglycan/xylan/chitin deacetylase (PgdA/CDA1 family)
MSSRNHHWLVEQDYYPTSTSTSEEPTDNSHSPNSSPSSNDPTNLDNQPSPTKPQTFSWLAGLTLVCLLLSLSVSGWASYRTATDYHTLTSRCQEILTQVQTEFGLPDNFCQRQLSQIHLQKNYVHTLQPHLSTLQQKYYPQYKKRQQALKKAQQKYDKQLQIYQELKLQKDTLEKPVEVSPGPNYMQRRTQALKTKTQELQLAFQNYLQSLSYLHTELDKTIQKGKDLGIDVHTATQLNTELHKLNLTDPQNVQELEQKLHKAQEQQKQLQQKIQQKKQELARQQRATEILSGDDDVTLPILMYHHIDNDNSSKRSKQELTVTPEEFRKQLDLLQEKNYETVSITDLETALLNQNQDFFQGKKVMLTFDDGWKEHYETVFPELQKRNMTGVFGIYNDYRALSDKQLQEMSNHGMDIISHSVSHCMLASARVGDGQKNPEGGEYQPCQNSRYGFGNNPLMPTKEVEYELQKSKQTLEDITNQNVNALIYPYGSYNQTTLDKMDKAGYTLGFTVGGGPGLDWDQPYQLDRVTIDGHDPALGGWFENIK